MWLGKGKTERTLKKAVSVLIAAAFFANYVLADAWAAIEPLTAPVEAVSQSAGSFPELDVDTFAIPENFGDIKARFKGSSGKVIVHIQDAHCAATAQHRVAEIIEYLNREYGITSVNMEGASGGYDLGVFTSISGDAIRREVADYFVDKGEINGAEFYAINNPGSVELWGVEDKELYVKNLQVYRDSLKYRSDVERYLAALDVALEALKKEIYTPELMELDGMYASYKEGKTDFREYIAFLSSKGAALGIDPEKYPSIGVLLDTMKSEKAIDFKAANRERDELVAELSKWLSVNDRKEFMARILEFKTKKISHKTFYAYLTNKAASLGVDLGRFQDLKRYSAYVSAYESLDISVVMNEMDGLEAAVREKLYKSDDERRLNLLSRNLAILKNIFRLSLTRADYQYYRENKKDFDMNGYVEFVKERSAALGVKTGLSGEVTALDGFRARITAFYDYSLERDDAFLRNIRFGETQSGSPGAMIMTGGFHAENLCELFRKNGISYVSIMPRFTLEKDKLNPYFGLLAGRSSEVEDMLRSVIAKSSMLQIASKLSAALGDAVWGEDGMYIFKAAVRVQELVKSGKKVEIYDKAAAEKGRVCLLTEGMGPVVEMTAGELLAEAGYVAPAGKTEEGTQKTPGAAALAAQAVSGTPSAVRTPMIFIISGPSGVGKDAVIDRVRAGITGAVLSISTTSREPRPLSSGGYEESGVQYNFVSKEEFERGIRDGEFVEYSEVRPRQYYGTSRKQIDKILASGNDVILNIDHKGARIVRNAFSGRNASIFIAPESVEALEERLRGRGTETEEQIAARMKNALEQMSAQGEYDRVVVNRSGKLENAVEDVQNIILAERGKRARPASTPVQSLLANLFGGVSPIVNTIVRGFLVFATPIHELGHLLSAKLLKADAKWTLKGLFTGEVEAERAPPSVLAAGFVFNLLAAGVSALFLIYSGQPLSSLSNIVLMYIAATNVASALVELIGAVFGRGDLATISVVATARAYLYIYLKFALVNAFDMVLTRSLPPGPSAVAGVLKEALRRQGLNPEAVKYHSLNMMKAIAEDLSPGYGKNRSDRAIDAETAGLFARISSLSENKNIPGSGELKDLAAVILAKSSPKEYKAVATVVLSAAERLAELGLTGSDIRALVERNISYSEVTPINAIMKEGAAEAYASMRGVLKDSGMSDSDIAEVMYALSRISSTAEQIGGSASFVPAISAELDKEVARGALKSSLMSVFFVAAASELRRGDKAQALTASGAAEVLAVMLLEFGSREKPEEALPEGMRDPVAGLMESVLSNNDTKATVVELLRRKAPEAFRALGEKFISAGVDTRSAVIVLSRVIDLPEPGFKASVLSMVMEKLSERGVKGKEAAKIAEELSVEKDFQDRAQAAIDAARNMATSGVTGRDAYLLVRSVLAVPYYNRSKVVKLLLSKDTARPLVKLSRRIAKAYSSGEVGKKFGRYYRDDFVAAVISKVLDSLTPFDLIDSLEMRDQFKGMMALANLCAKSGMGQSTVISVASTAAVSPNFESLAPILMKMVPAVTKASKRLEFGSSAADKLIKTAADILIRDPDAAKTAKPLLEEATAAVILDWFAKMEDMSSTDRDLASDKEKLLKTVLEASDPAGLASTMIVIASSMKAALKDTAIAGYEVEKITLNLVMNFLGSDRPLETAKAFVEKGGATSLGKLYDSITKPKVLKKTYDSISSYGVDKILENICKSGDPKAKAETLSAALDEWAPRLDDSIVLQRMALGLSECEDMGARVFLMNGIYDRISAKLPETTEGASRQSVRDIAVSGTVQMAAKSSISPEDIAKKRKTLLEEGGGDEIALLCEYIHKESGENLTRSSYSFYDTLEKIMAGLLASPRPAAAAAEMRLLSEALRKNSLLDPAESSFYDVLANLLTYSGDPAASAKTMRDLVEAVKLEGFRDRGRLLIKALTDKKGHIDEYAGAIASIVPNMAKAANTAGIKEDSSGYGVFVFSVIDSILASNDPAGKARALQEGGTLGKLAASAEALASCYGTGRDTHWSDSTAGAFQAMSLVTGTEKPGDAADGVMIAVSGMKARMEGKDGMSLGKFGKSIPTAVAAFMGRKGVNPEQSLREAGNPDTLEKLVDIIRAGEGMDEFETVIHWACSGDEPGKALSMFNALMNEVALAKLSVWNIKSYLSRIARRDDAVDVVIKTTAFIGSLRAAGAARSEADAVFDVLSDEKKFGKMPIGDILDALGAMIAEFAGRQGTKKGGVGLGDIVSVVLESEDPLRTARELSKEENMRALVLYSTELALPDSSGNPLRPIFANGEMRKNVDSLWRLKQALLSAGLSDDYMNRLVFAVLATSDISGMAEDAIKIAGSDPSAIDPQLLPERAARIACEIFKSATDRVKTHDSYRILQNREMLTPYADFLMAQAKGREAFRGEALKALIRAAAPAESETFDISRSLNERITELVHERPADLVPILEDICRSGDERTKKAVRSAIMALAPHDIAIGLRVNIKLARYLKERGTFDRMFNSPVFRDMINELSYNLNREMTLHPAERRVGEDEKTNLFDYIFALDDMAGAKAVFDSYFRNDPEQYRMSLSAVNELFSYLSLDDIKKIIRAVLENPKESLSEIEDSLKAQLRGMENAEFVIRRMSWILSNLFVLQRKVEQLDPIVAAFKKAGRTIEEFRDTLNRIDKAKRFSELASLAAKNGLSVANVLDVKLESVLMDERETILADALEYMDSVKEEDAKRDLSAVLSEVFESLPAESRERVYFKAICGKFTNNTDNKALLKVIAQLRDAGKIAEPGRMQLLASFLERYADIVRDNASFAEFTSALADRKARDAALAQFRNLYRERAYSQDGLEVRAASGLEALKARIAHPAVSPRMPHVFFEPLIKLKADTTTLDAMRDLVTALNANEALRGQLATYKNRLYEKALFFSGLKGADTAKLFAGIVAAVVRKDGVPTVGNSEKFYNDLLYYLEQYMSVVSAAEKAAGGLFPETINDLLKEVSGGVISAMLERGEIDAAKLDDLKGILAGLESDTVLARFKSKIKIADEAEVLAKMKRYAAENPRFSWTDYQGRNIYKLIDTYLRTIDNPEIYQNIFDALMAEIDGNFKDWKYDSRDYRSTIDESILIEAGKLSDADREKFDTEVFEPARREGTSLYEKLKKAEGFDDLKLRIERIREWEETLKYDAGNERTAEFADDFYTIFNIGNYRGTTACQNCTYGSALNRGLAGYVSNGTNKAIALLDKNGHVVTRRIVRLRILTDEEGTSYPAIFIEENSQFGTENLDALYAALVILSARTGLPVVVGKYRVGPSRILDQGRDVTAEVGLLRGRSTFDYSDTYGSGVQGQIQAGLFSFEGEKAKVRPHVTMAMLSAAASPEKDIEKEFNLAREEVPRRRGAEPLPAPKLAPKVTTETLFDMKMAVFGRNATIDEIIAAEAEADIQMVRVKDPTQEQIDALEGKGYFLRPAKISYSFDHPLAGADVPVEKAMEKYFEMLGKKDARQMKKDVEGIDKAIAAGEFELVTDEGVDPAVTGAFLDLYTKEMGGKERGRTPLLDQIRKEGGDAQAFMKNNHTGIYLRRKDGTVIGGIIVKKTDSGYSISYAATDKEAFKAMKLRSAQFYLVQHMIQRTMREGYSRLGYGVDTNLYGHHLSSGLAQAKLRAKFEPEPGKDKELMKITKFGIFDMPVFFYRLNRLGAIVPTLIITDDMKDVVRQFVSTAGVTSVFVLREGQLVKTSVEEIERAIESEKKAAGEAPGTVEKEEAAPQLELAAVHSLLASMFGGVSPLINYVVRGVLIFATPIHEFGHLIVARLMKVKTQWTLKGLIEGEVEVSRAPPSVLIAGFVLNILAAGTAALFLIYSGQPLSSLTSMVLLYIAATNAASALAELIGILFKRGDLARAFQLMKEKRATEIALPTFIRMNGASLRINGMVDQNTLDKLSRSVDATHNAWKQPIVNLCAVLSRLAGRKIDETFLGKGDIHILGSMHLSKKNVELKYPSEWKPAIAWGNHFVTYFVVNGRHIVVDVTAREYTEEDANPVDAEMFAAGSFAELKDMLSLRYGGTDWAIRDSLKEYDLKAWYPETWRRSYLENLDMERREGTAMILNHMRRMEASYGKAIGRAVRLAARGEPASEENMGRDWKDWEDLVDFLKDPYMGDAIETAFGRVFSVYGGYEAAAAVGMYDKSLGMKVERLLGNVTGYLQKEVMTPAVAARVRGALMSNEDAGTYIRSAISLKYFAASVSAKTEEEKRALLDLMKKDGAAFEHEGVTFIKIGGLFKETGQFGHIGLGKTYGVPVVYVDSALADSAVIRGHEIEEIRSWQEAQGVHPYLKNVKSINAVRDWMRANPDKAVELAEAFHARANAKFNVDKVLVVGAKGVLVDGNEELPAAAELTPALAAAPGQRGPKAETQSLYDAVNISIGRTGQPVTYYWPNHVVRATNLYRKVVEEIALSGISVERIAPEDIRAVAELASKRKPGQKIPEKLPELTASQREAILRGVIILAFGQEGADISKEIRSAIEADDLGEALRYVSLLKREALVTPQQALIASEMLRKFMLMPGLSAEMYVEMADYWKDMHRVSAASAWRYKDTVRNMATRTLQKAAKDAASWKAKAAARAVLAELGEKIDDGSEEETKILTIKPAEKKPPKKPGESGPSTPSLAAAPEAPAPALSGYQPFDLAMLQRGFKGSLNGEEVHVRGISPDLVEIRNYIRTNNVRTASGERASAAVKRVYLPLLFLDVNASMEARGLVTAQKGEDRLPGETVRLLREAAARGEIELKELKDLSDYIKAAEDLKINFEKFEDMLQSSSIIFVSEWAGTDLKDYLNGRVHDREALERIGRNLADVLKALHENSLICNDTHLSQFVVDEATGNVKRIDLVNIYAFADLGQSEMVRNNVRAEYSEIAQKLPAEAAAAFIAAYPGSIAEAIAGGARSVVAETPPAAAPPVQQVVKTQPADQAVEKMKADKRAYSATVEAAKTAIGDLQWNVADWIITPSNDEAISAKKSVDSAVSRKFRKDFGSDTAIRDYNYNAKDSNDVFKSNLRDVFRKVIAEMMDPKNAGKKPRALAWVPADKYGLAEEVLEEIKASGTDELKKYAGRITLIKEAAMPENGVVDEVMHVVAGKGLLNAERFIQEEYGKENARFEGSARDNLIAYLRSLDPTLPDGPEVIENILKGVLSIKIAPIDYKEIQEWKAAQDEVLRSL